MATVDFTKPVTSDLRADVLQYIRDAIQSQARMFNGDTLVSAPVNTIRYNPANKELEKWNGTSWTELPFQFLRHSGDVLHLVAEQVYATGSSLGTGFGDVKAVAQFRVLDNNATRLEVSAWRIGAGSTHDTSQTRIGRIVDSTRMGYVGFSSDTERRVVLGDMVYGEGSFGEFYRIRSDGLMISTHTGAGFYLGPTTGQVGAEWAKWHGLAFLTQPSIGGWARGMQVRRSTDNAFIAGIGYLGTDNAVDAIRLGFGSAWYAGNHNNPGLSITNTGSTALRGSGAELALYSRNDGSSYMSWYCPNPGQMFLYNNANSGNRFEFDNGNIYCRANDNLTLWLCPSDNRSLGLHVNSDIAYFMNSTVNGGTSWGTVLDWQSIARYPMILGLTSGHLEVAGRVTAFSGVTSHYGLEVNNGTGLFFRTTGLTDYTTGCIEVRTGAGDAGIGFHNSGANAGSLIYSRANNRFEFRSNPVSGPGNVAFNNFYGEGSEGILGPTSSAGDRHFSLQNSSRRVALYMQGTACNLYDFNASNWRWTTDTSGNFTAIGNVTAYSDRRLKKDISTLDGALRAVRRMRGVLYERIDTGSLGVGVVAQEMREIAPRVVLEGEDGTLGVAYGNLAAYFIEAIKELSRRLERLEGTNEDS
jgi:hypothetical protein